MKCVQAWNSSPGVTKATGSGGFHFQAEIPGLRHWCNSRNKSVLFGVQGDGFPAFFIGNWKPVLAQPGKAVINQSVVAAGVGHLGVYGHEAIYTRYADRPGRDMFELAHDRNLACCTVGLWR